MNVRSTLDFGVKLGDMRHESIGATHEHATFSYVRETTGDSGATGARSESLAT